MVGSLTTLQWTPTFFKKILCSQYLYSLSNFAFYHSKKHHLPLTSLIYLLIFPACLTSQTSFQLLNRAYNSILLLLGLLRIPTDLH